MIWLPRIMFDISGALSLRGSEAAEVSTGDGVQTRAVLLHDRSHADATMQGIERLPTNVDRRRHGPRVLHQGRQTERGHDEAGLMEARQPPGLHDRADLRDPLAEAELLHRRHQLQVERAVA